MIKGVYFDALFLTNGNLATHLNSHGHGEGRCPHDVITMSRLMLWRKRVFSYRCGFYACSFNLMGMQEPQYVGRVVTEYIFGGETTGISQIEDGKLKIGNGLYDLQGRRVESSILNSQSSTTKKGLYIVNGKKIIK